MTLPFVGDDTVHLDSGTSMWVQLTHFLIDPAQDDQAILERLIESPGYQHDYASPFPSAAEVRPWGIHGRWRIDAIHPGLFQASTAEAAKAEIDAWAKDQDWTDPGYSQPADAIQRLETIYSVLGSGTVLKLRNPPPEAEHDYGFVTGSLGFYEYIVIDRTLRTLHVIVASDD
ncbi:hypothetical protein OVA06_13725 [Pseudarthrobacter sp. SL88]|uniref:hypothetical protein n=1 Tax=Pseudarthrobacter sp. SL88 TaxID=2994666 RepID=UPI002272EC87|nr:hypothetical protein [Pseudarthrobacter sp. SL88]MCY1675753.1 hypothetical protein [Pseudarthrobacter sp. SL88]